MNTGPAGPVFHWRATMPVSGLSGVRAATQAGATPLFADGGKA